ncbi:MAG: hypothetical protein AUI83_01500 [Armatimonadetes bacterium 13_1_40CM_3_65_7]|nr:MAG: hypothetical protein AUI83_01500 [Armatimonadetes bacterium 13_1_40CM_3_65_7]
MRRTVLGRILLWAAPILLVAGIALKAADLREIAGAVVGAKPGWLAVALLLAILFTLNQGALYRAIFRLFDVKISLRVAVRLALVMAFGSLAPAGTVAGMAYFVATAREHGIPGPRAILTSLAFYLFDYGALLPFVAAGVTVLLTHHGAEAGIVIAGGVILLATAAAAAALLWGLADGRGLETASRLASAVNTFVARLHRRPVDLAGVCLRYSYTGWPRNSPALECWRPSSARSARHFRGQLRWPGLRSAQSSRS